MTHDDESGERERHEAEALFERTVRRMFKTPPKPQKEMKLGRRPRAALVGEFPQAGPPPARDQQD